MASVDGTRHLATGVLDMKERDFHLNYVSYLLVIVGIFSGMWQSWDLPIV